MEIGMGLKLRLEFVIRVGCEGVVAALGHENSFRFFNDDESSFQLRTKFVLHMSRHEIVAKTQQNDNFCGFSLAAHACQLFFLHEIHEQSCHNEFGRCILRRENDVEAVASLERRRRVGECCAH